MFRNWSLKTKYTIVFTVLCLLPLIFYAHNIFATTIKQLQALEQDYLKQQLHIVENLLDRTSKQLLLVNQDYSQWNEVYNKVDAGDLEWFRDNMSGWLPSFAEVDIVLLLNRKGKIVDNYNTIDLTVSDFSHHPLFQAAMQKEKGYQIRKTQLGPAIITYTPILPTNGQGQPRGVLILGKLLNERIIRELNNFSSAQFFFFNRQGEATHISDILLPQGIKNFQEYKGPVLVKGELVVNNTSERHGFLLSPLRDYQGEIIGAIEVVSPEDRILKIMDKILLLSTSTLIVSLFFSLVLAFSFSHLLSRRITNLAKKASQAAGGDFSVTIPTQGKDEIGQLAKAFQELLQTINRKIIDLEETNQELTRLKAVAEELSITDDLTQLYNYRYLKSYLEMEVKKSHRYQHSLSLLMIDIDYFKNYNDCNGHPAGNQVLIQLAAIFRKSCRETDIIARYGGEEFSIVLPETDINNAMLVAESIRKKIQSTVFPLADNQPNGKISVSIGLANLPRDAQTVEELIAKADLALYWAKNNGRNRAILYCPYLE